MNAICLDIDLNSVCRICLSQTDMSEHLFNIFSDAIVDGMLVALPDVIEYCVDIQAREVYGVPNQICQSCKAKMFEFYLFKLKCHRTDGVLRTMLDKKTESESDATDKREDKYGTGLYHEAQNTDLSEAAFTMMCASESMLSVHSSEESLQDEIHNDDRAEKMLGYGSSLADILSIDGDNVSSVPASIEEEYIEEMYEELASSPSTSNVAAIDEHRSSEQIHMTITQMSANATHCFACEICGLPCVSKARLKRHTKLHDDSNAVLSQMNFFSCTVCKTMYLSAASLNEHSRDCSTQEQTGALYGDDRDLEALLFEERVAKSNGHCGICDASYPSTVQLKQHIITHMEKFPCPFEGCGCEYASLARLNIHVNSKHVDYFAPTCPHCKEDIDRADLSQHLRTSCKAKRFKCSHCDKKFLSSRALSQHMKELQQRFQCNQCNKSYSSRATYKLHLRSHSGERPFVCTVCNKSYKTASLRTAHMDSHIEGKTFECSICGKFLQTRTSYRNHIKRHLEERSHGCNICGKKFYTKHSLRIHQETVHKVKRSACLDHVVDE